MPEVNKKIAEWIEELTQKDTLPQTCKALLVGLFEGESTYQVYLVGSDEYDSDDDDWACSQDFTPEPRYLDTGIPRSRQWQAVLQAVVSAVRGILASGSDTILYQSPHVSVGFDDGDLEHVK